MHLTTLQKDKSHRVSLTLTALFASALAISAGAQPANSSTDRDPTDESSPIVLDKFTSVGSRIKNIDAAGPNPVSAFNRGSLETAGFGNVGDALRSLPMMSGISLTPAASNNSFTPGVSTVNVRGLGDNNVLVLLNGRRAAPFATPGFNGLLTVFDFNSIPAAAVESIEVLKDGGSAIYGSDAVSGVIDIKLRKKYSGVSVETEFGNTTHTDSLEKSASIVLGTSKGPDSIVAAFDWKERNPIRDSDYSFSSDANLTNRGGPDRRSYAGYPGLAYVPSLDDYYTISQPMVNPTQGDFSVADLSHGSYNFQSVTDQTPKTKNYGFYARESHNFTPYLYAFVELSFRRSESIIGAAPTPVFNYNEHGDSPDGYLSIPATNPNNPFGEDLGTEWYARLVHAGNRINDVRSDTPRGLLGVGGKIADTSWTWEAGALYTRNNTSNKNRGSVFDDLYQNALNGVNIGGQVLYANPFGPEDPRVTDYYPTAARTARSLNCRPMISAPRVTSSTSRQERSRLRSAVKCATSSLPIARMRTTSRGISSAALRAPRSTASATSGQLMPNYACRSSPVCRRRSRAVLSIIVTSAPPRNPSTRSPTGQPIGCSCARPTVSRFWHRISPTCT